ncbi:chemotaxis protein CheW [Planctobacterium marinum]|uniref:chemotaxis protein CheW n=3 Tax=Planctobacterium marinum TaxID=1631968 RepID=UPI003612AB66
MNENQAQLLSFTLGDNIYGLDITRVQEIRALGEIRKLPNTPSHCMGVIDFRHAMVPILDLRDIFGYTAKSIDKQTVMVVVSVGEPGNEMLVGIVVDTVSDVIAVSLSEIKKSPRLGNNVSTEFMTGMFKYQDKIVVMLSLESIFETEKFDDLKTIVQQQTALV